MLGFWLGLHWIFRSIEGELTSIQFSHSVMSSSLWRHGLQHTRLPCPSPTPRAYSNSCPLSQWCHPTISSSAIPSPPAFNFFQHQGLSQWVSFCIRWPKYWSFRFSISPSKDIITYINKHEWNFWFCSFWEHENSMVPWPLYPGDCGAFILQFVDLVTRFIS